MRAAMKKRNTMKEGNPNPKQECSDLAKSFLHLSNRFVDLFDRKHMAAKWVNENIVKIVNR